MSALRFFCLVLLFPAALPAADQKVEQYPSWGIAFAEPGTQWTEMIKDRQTLIGYWYRFDAAGRPIALLMVEGAQPLSPSVDADAKYFADEHKGVVTATTLDGEKAALVTCAPSFGLDHPERIIVARHRGYQYMIFSAAKPNNSTDSEVEKIRASWKWIDFEPPAKHAELGPAFSVLGGLVTIRYPRLMRTYPVQDAKTKLDLGLYNLERNAPDFAAIVQVAPKEPENELAAIAEVYLPRLVETMKVTDKPMWRKLNGSTPRLITTPFLAQISKKEEKTKVMWAMVLVDERRILLINFTLAAATPAEDDLFAKAAEKMVESIELIKTK